MQSPSVVITPHDDDLNIYLTILCRKLRPDVQIISRATLDRNVSSLHRAGADIVASYASMGANAIFNLLQRSDVLMVAEGLSVFKVKMPASLKEAKEALLVPIPEWTERQRAICTINGGARAGHFEQGYLNVGPVKAADVILVTFPMVERVIKAQLNKIERQVTLRGNTVIDMQSADNYPLANHMKYQSDRAPLKTVERFVSRERFVF